MTTTSSLRSGNASDDYQDESGILDNIEDRLIDAFDSLSAKSAKTRLVAFEFIRKTLTEHYMIDFILNRKITLLDSIGRCIKRNKGQDLGYAAIIISVLSASIGVCQDTDQVFSDLMSQMLDLLMDPTIGTDIKAKCVQSVGICCFIIGQSMDGYVEQVMMSLYSIFVASCAKGDGTMPQISEQLTSLHCACLQAWTLLLTTLIQTPSAQVAIELIEEYMDKITELLDSPSLEMRIAAGESLAIMCETIRSQNDDITADDFYELCEKIRQLTTDSQKFKGKKDLRQQRSNFRDILSAIEDDEPPNATIKFGRERLSLDLWSRKRQYDAFCDLLGSGMNHHLAENEVIRDIFELGPVVLDLDYKKTNKSDMVCRLT